MTICSWQPTTPFDAIIFDCDGTLSTIEGIDELAKQHGVGKEVETLTQQAMSQTGMTLELYQQRLQLVQPTQQQVCALGETYFHHCVQDIIPLLALLQRLGKNLYLVSAGLYPAVALFGKKLAIPQENIFAVDIQFNSEGNFLNFDHHSPLTQREGKYDIVSTIKKQHKTLIYVGDGLNDCSVIPLANRFIGYGGAFYRKNIEALCQYYIRTASMTPLLPLTLTEEENNQLSVTEKCFYEQGITAIQKGEVKI